MKVLVVEPKRKPYVKEINSGLKSLQNEVDGLIEYTVLNNEVGLIFNEEGKILGLEYNRGLYTDDGELYDIIAGTFLVVGLSDNNFKGLTDEQVDKYYKIYETPTMFVWLGDEILELPLI